MTSRIKSFGKKKEKSRLIKLYSTGCPRCHVLETKLREKGISYEEVNDKELMISMGFTEVPMLDIDGKIYNFSEAVKWLKEASPASNL